MRHLLRTVSALTRASHPHAVLAVTAVAGGLALTYGQAPGSAAVATAAVFAGQLSVGWLNDLVDAARDAEAGRSGKPVATGRLSPSLLRVGVPVAGGVAVALSLPSGPLATGAHLLALASAWAYDLGVKSRASSVVPYVVSFGLLPAFVTLGLPGAPPPPVWLVAAAALLGGAAHFVNAVPDLSSDAAVGVRGLPHRLGAARSGAAAAALVLAASVLLVVGPPGEVRGVGVWVVPLSAAIVGAGLAWGRRPGSRAAFHAVLLVAVVDVALLLAADMPPGDAPLAGLAPGSGVSPW
ncbi:UbiA family prenyltransferase [Streptomyces sp. 4N509B]|uniref:UbiA family prenyltransferase n=1 Tax=Streptomyces sp. 4N509B TaxID=3457413 RepID=UPI003FD32AF6